MQSPGSEVYGVLSTKSDMGKGNTAPRGSGPRIVSHRSCASTEGWRLTTLLLHATPPGARLSASHRPSPPPQTTPFWRRSPPPPPARHPETSAHFVAPPASGAVRALLPCALPPTPPPPRLCAIFPCSPCNPHLHPTSLYPPFVTRALVAVRKASPPCHSPGPTAVGR